MPSNSLNKVSLMPSKNIRFRESVSFTKRRYCCGCLVSTNIVYGLARHLALVGGQAFQGTGDAGRVDQFNLWTRATSTFTGQKTKVILEALAAGVTEHIKLHTILPPAG